MLKFELGARYRYTNPTNDTVDIVVTGEGNSADCFSGVVIATSNPGNWPIGHFTKDWYRDKWVLIKESYTSPDNKTFI